MTAFIPTHRKAQTKTRVFLMDLNVLSDRTGIVGEAKIEEFDTGRQGTIYVDHHVLTDDYLRDVLHTQSFNVWESDIEWDE